MATPPTFVAEYECSDWLATTSPKTTSVTVATGDVIAVVAAGENELATISTPTGGGLTYNLEQSVVVANYTTVYVWTATAASSQTFTISVSRGATSLAYGFNVLRFSGSDGVGASAKTNVASGAPSLALTTLGDNSAVVEVNADWNATDGTTRTWRTVNAITPSAGNGLEVTYARSAASYAVYAAYWSDAGTAGSKTTGLSAPSGQKYSVIAVEVKGAASSTVNGTATIAGAGAVAAPVIQSVTAAPAGAGTLTGTVVQRAAATPTGAGTLTAPAVQAVTAAPAGVGALTATVTEGVTAAISGAGALTSPAVLSVTATLAGAGVLSASSGGVIPGAASLAGSGVLSATVVQQAVATMSGAGTLTSPAVQVAPAQMAGAGVLTAAGMAAGAGGASLAGTGALTARAVQGSGAAPTAAGALTAAVTLAATASLVGAGALTAAGGGGTFNATSSPTVTAVDTSTAVVSASRSSIPTVAAAGSSTSDVADG